MHHCPPQPTHIRITTSYRHFTRTPHLTQQTLCILRGLRRSRTHTTLRLQPMRLLHPLLPLRLHLLLLLLLHSLHLLLLLLLHSLHLLLLLLLHRLRLLWTPSPIILLHHPGRSCLLRLQHRRPAG